MRSAAIGFIALALAGCSGEGEPPAAAKPAPGEFRTIVAEIFEPHCATPGCHGGEHPAAQLALTSGRAYEELVDVAAQRRPDRVLVAPGDPGASYLLERLVPEGDTPVMPLGDKALSGEQVERVRKWIRQGAKP